MNEWEDSWKALRDYIQIRTGKKIAMEEFKQEQFALEFYKEYYRRNRKEIDKDIAKTTRNEMRMWLKVYAKLTKGQEN